MIDFNNELINVLIDGATVSCRLTFKNSPGYYSFFSVANKRLPILQILFLNS